MTCIAAVTDGRVVYMAADSAGVSGSMLSVRKDPKIYAVGEYLFGFSSSFRMGQLLGYRFVPPTHYDGDDAAKFMATTFADALRKTMETGGYAMKKEGREEGGEFLVGYRGRIFHVYGDFQIAENAECFDSAGCGADLALGALFTTKKSKNQIARLEHAMNAAEAFSAGVRRPFIYRQA